MTVEPENLAAVPEEVPPPETRRPSALALFEVFRHRNYRVFFSGQIVSLMGGWVTMVAQGWLVYALTNSPLMLGVVAFCSQVPVFFLSAFGGMIADRVDRRKLIIITQALCMLQAAMLAILTLTGVIAVWHIVVLALFKGVINAFDMPTRQAFTTDMVGKGDLRNAIALNSVMFNIARILGPAIAGILVATVGEGICFAIDAISYAAVLTSLFLIKVAPRPQRVLAHPLQELKAGFIYAWRNRQIRQALMLIGISSAFGASYIQMMPAFVRDVLGQGSRELGYLLGAIGAGALCGAYALARIHEHKMSTVPIISAAAFGLGLCLFANAPTLPLAMILSVPTAFSLMLLGGSTNTIIQTVAADHMRGRVVALYTMGFLGMMPWGSLILGWLGGLIGIGHAIAIGGAVCILAALIAYTTREPAAQVGEQSERGGGN